MRLYYNHIHKVKKTENVVILTLLILFYFGHVKIHVSSPSELGEDAIVQSHLASLYDNLLEKNLLHLLLPYSRVQISYISSKIGLSSNDIEIKLSQMILDKILYAVIDNNSGCLLIQSASNETTLATKTLATDCDTFGLIQASFKNVDSIIESLIIKSKTI